jgi:hypothetical protein
MGVRSTFQAAAIGGLSTAETIHKSVQRAKNGILDRLMYWEGKKFVAKKVSEKKKIAKKITDLKSKYKKLAYIA